MEPLNMRRKRWNLLGFVASVIITFGMMGLIIYGQEHKGQLEDVLYILVRYTGSCIICNYQL
ncbi:Uncharacterised protein [Prevotella intermedia]|nr:Uncharacterised protein [Prevotella intermedia]